MSKVGRNSSACWRDLTCTTTHYFTQPIPNMLSWYMHHLPLDFHKLEVALTFVEQLVLPFLMLAPVRWLRIGAAVAEICFQMGIVGTGNYAWINFIGALPCISMLDDSFLLFLTPWPFKQKLRESVEEATEQAESLSLLAPHLPSRMAVRGNRAIRLIVNVTLMLVMVYKSKDPIKELFGPAPWINSYDDWFLMNAQGVFGFINQHRVQVVMKYTHDKEPGSPTAEWKHLDFKCLPGNTDRRPCFMSPYHYRLDWETWIRVTASMEHLWAQRVPAEHYHNQLPEFLQALLVKILNGDDDAIGLMGVAPEELLKNDENPTAISVDFASYTFTGKKDQSEGSWWKSEPVSSGSLRAYSARSVQMPKEQIRKSPRMRHWILGSCALASVFIAERGLPALAPLPLMAAVLLAYVFCLALASDYQEFWSALTALQLIPQALLQQVPACSTNGASVQANQKCCYAYSAIVLGGFGFFGLLLSLGDAARVLFSSCGNHRQKLWLQRTSVLILLGVAGACFKANPI
eukprot:TRINITY_DN96374_c0_g1_i1.p1 TRINITY_DN96374_c0_g1~~TRINITY_DN96374_c0_g1_i1.p1  ORF type:complete len:536 (-),score=66.64 TRINITY_DN96374_c0_g1_i1:136-1689(-)